MIQYETTPDEDTERQLKWMGRYTAGLWTSGFNIIVYVSNFGGSVRCPACNTSWPICFDQVGVPHDKFHGSWSISGRDMEIVLDSLTIEVVLDSTVNVTPGIGFAFHDCCLPMDKRPYTASMMWIDKEAVVRELQEVYRYARDIGITFNQASPYYTLVYTEKNKNN